jgi:hypothetical protein
MAGIHIVTRSGGPPGIGALLTRNVFRLVDSLPLLYGVGLVATFATRDHVRIGDMAAGTILVYERPDVILPERATPTAASSEQALRNSDAEVITELLTRWPQLESAARQHLATAILTRHGINGTTASGRSPDTATPSQQGANAPHPRPIPGASTPPQTDTELRAQLERLLRGAPT